jgi:hypothetical protein
MNTQNNHLTMSECEITNDTDVFSSLSSFHKLKYRWNLWAHLPQDIDWSSKSYIKVYSFNTIEQAISILEIMPPELIKSCMLFIMRDGIVPTWEDPKNRNGGAFSYKVSNKTVVDIWKELTYVLVGDTISTNNSFTDCVTGITISPKKNFCIVKIWMTNCEHQNPQIVTNEIRLIPQGCLFKNHNPEY